MTKKEALRITELIYRLCEHGFPDAEVEAMRRVSHTLTRWCEAECNGEIERMTGSNKPEHVHESRGLGGQWIRYHYPIPDRENGAIKRMNRILAENTGKTPEQVKLDSERGNWMIAEEAKEYGLVDKVIYKR